MQKTAELNQNKVALITGVTGQDGSLLSRLLLSKGYSVWGTTRDVFSANTRNLKALGIADQVKLVSMRSDDFRSVFVVLSKVKPDEIYHFAGQSSVSLSFESPAETMQSIGMSTLNLLEVARLIGQKIRIYFAGSSECFGDTQDVPADETTAFAPNSPYGVAKSAAFWLVKNYREAYGVHAVTGTLFNHESAMRPSHFVTKKISLAALRISQGDREKLLLGRLDIARDWGLAEEYMEAIWLMLQQTQPHDLVIATGTSCSLEEFLAASFRHVGLEWRDHVKQDNQHFRPSEISISRANPSKAQAVLGWKAKTHMPDLASKLIEDLKAMT